MGPCTVGILPVNRKTQTNRMENITFATPLAGGNDCSYLTVNIIYKSICNRNFTVHKTTSIISYLNQPN